MCRKDFPNRVLVIGARMRLLKALRTAAKQETEFADVIRSIVQNDHKDYLSFSLDCPGTVAYSRPGKVHRWDDARRTRTTFGRYLRRQLSVETSDTELDRFVSRIIALDNGDSGFELVRGADITTAYRRAIGKHTCMTGSDAYSLVSMYEHNPTKVGLLIYRSGEFSARALVWTCDNGTVVMDRIYPNDGQHLDKFHQYATRRGWVHRGHNSLPSGNVPLSDGKSHKVTVRSPEGTWPYLDTFFYADGDENGACLCNRHIDGFDVILNRTDGEWSDGSGCRCDRCGTRIDLDYGDYCSVGDSTYCSSCLSEYFTWSEVEEEYIPNDDVQHSEDTDEYASEYYARHNWWRCGDCSQWYAESESGRDNPDGEWWCTDCLDEATAVCDDCGSEVWSGNAVLTDDGVYCEDCIEDHLAVEPESVVADCEVSS